MFVIGYNNQFTVVQIYIFCKLFFQDNQNKLLAGNPMGLSTPRTDCIDIISLCSIKILTGMNPMRFSDPWSDYLDIIDLKPVKIILGINPMVLSAPWADSLDIIAFQPVKK